MSGPIDRVKDNLNYNSGVYLLQLKLSGRYRLKIGALGYYFFPAGYYYYCGSAQKNMKARLERHLSEDKKLYWHIDFLLCEAEIEKIYCWEEKSDFECRLAEKISSLAESEIIVDNFGASDCSCESHLFYFSFSPNLNLESGLITGKPGDYYIG